MAATSGCVMIDEDGIGNVPPMCLVEMGRKGGMDGGEGYSSRKVLGRKIARIWSVSQGHDRAAELTIDIHVTIHICRVDRSE